MPTDHPDLTIQIHPHRAPELDIARVRATCESLSGDRALIARFSFVEGHDGYDYVNLNFGTDDIPALWSRLQDRLYSGEHGAAMQRSSMAMCVGQHGWDDYLLLRHYDAAVACVSLPDRT